MAKYQGKSILFSPSIEILPIDEHYNPTSDNAQSGTAVNEATETIAKIKYWNLTTNTEITERKKINSSGELVTENGQYTTDYLPIDKNQYIYFFCEQLGSVYSSTGYNDRYCARTVAFYDNDKNLIEAHAGYIRSPYREADIPINSKFVRISFAYLNSTYTDGTGDFFVTQNLESDHKDILVLDNKADVKTELKKVSKKIDISYYEEKSTSILNTR